MKMKKINIYSDKTGDLVPISLKYNIPFKTREYLSFMVKKSFRADHAHYKCSQYLLPLSGTIIVNYQNRKGKFKKILSLK